MSINITYISSSGHEYDLMADRAILTKNANYHKWTWVASGTAQQFGKNVTGFIRDSAVYETRLMFRGTYAENKTLIQNLHEDFELDMITLRPAKIIWGEYYIECFVTASSTYPDDANRTVNDIEIYCPYPFWIKDVTRSFSSGGTASETGLDYPYDYPFEYAHDASGSVPWATGTLLPSEYTMIIYGAVSNPIVSINGLQIGVYATISAGEYVTIDSRNHTVIKTGVDGMETNLFDDRVKTNSIFARLGGSNLLVEWNGLFAFDVTLHTERSEPR